MEKKFKIGVIGAGYMASSIILSAINTGILKNSDVIVSDINDQALNKFEQIGVLTTKNNLELANVSEFVFFAVKPQNTKDLFDEIKNCSCDKFISIMAGIKKEKIRASLNENVKIARCMPNAPCAVCKGSVGIDLADFANQSDIDFIKSLFSAVAEVIEVDESLLNAVTGISGSAPAYFYLFAKGLIDSGIKNGLSQEQAFKFVVNTMIGSGEMLLKNRDKNISELIDSVCSKGGTTIEAINVYNQNNLADITEKAVDACVKRSFELENI